MQANRRRLVDPEGAFHPLEATACLVESPLEAEDREADLHWDWWGRQVNHSAGKLGRGGWNVYRVHW